MANANESPSRAIVVVTHDLDLAAKANRRVHVVDGSVFPTMPAASPTLTIMANARRIAVWSQRGQET